MTVLQQESDVRAIVASVWSEMLPFTAFDDELTWRESGVDSLKSLQFLLRLEQVLGRPVSFDAITRDMTVGDLVRLLAASAPAQAGKAGPDLTVFLIPGVFGDEPVLAEFRKSLTGRVGFHTLTLPDIERPTSVLSDLKATAALLVAQVQAAQPDGPLHIAGYSIGGLLAHQVACDLVAAGREVRGVALFDALLSVNPLVQLGAVSEHAEAAPTLSWFLKRRGEGFSAYGERIAYGLCRRLGALETARRITLANLGRHELETNYGRRRYLIGRMRGRAMLTWRPSRLEVPVLLVTSDDFEKHCPVARWRTLCPDLTVQPVPGHHGAIFDPPGLARLNPALLAFLGRAEPQMAAA